MHAEFERVISDYEFLRAHYTVHRSYISGANGTEVLYKGLYKNIDSIKSTANVSICIVEEAEPVSEKSWEDLIPTIRKDGSEIWVIWNPRSLDSPTRKRFVLNPPSDSKIVEINWRDNPWFPKVLERERQECLRLYPERYDHIWEGACETRSDALVFSGKWTVEEFMPRADWVPYLGADWGFANDPTTLIKLYLQGDTIYVEHESWAVRLELDDTADRWRRDVPGCDRFVIRADNARPESISHVRRRGFNRLEPCKKYAGSVQDGIAFLTSKRWVVHPRCKRTIEELSRYSYKVDNRTGEILPTVLDANNHLIDAARYAVQEFIKPKRSLPRKAEIAIR